MTTIIKESRTVKKDQHKKCGIYEEMINESLKVEKDWCKGCGICVAFCPTNVLEMKNGKVNIKDIEACIQCGLCELRCPDFAIYLGGK